MTRLRIALLVFITSLFVLVPALPANAAKGCVIDILGIKVCGELLTPLPTITVTQSPVTLPPVTISVPGPTATVHVPGPTVHVPGPTSTVTAPGNTQTVTAYPSNPGPSELPSAASTATVTATGQTSTSRATVTVSPSPEVRTNTETRTKTETIVKNVALGALVTLLLALLGFVALLIGYYFGYKDSENEEKHFLGNLLDYAKSGKHT